MPPRHGPADYHHHPVHGPGPGHPPQRTPRTSLFWGLAPLYSLGMATPFLMVHAAIRLRSAVIASAGAAYFVLLMFYLVASSAFDDKDPATPEDPRFTLAISAHLLIGWIGGTVHAMVLRKSVFRPVPVHRASHLPPAPQPARYPPGTVPRQQPHRAPTAPSTRQWQGPGHRPPPHPSPAPPPSHAQPYRPAPAHPPRPTTGPSQPSQPSQPSWPDTRHSQPSYPNAGPPHSLQPARIGPYVPTRTLGEGGQGTVYLAQAPNGGLVAVKVLNSRAIGGLAERESFLKEAELARRVRSFSTARVIDTGMADDLVYIVSEYVPGPSLDKLVREQGPRDGDSLTRIAVGTIAALKGIHAAHVVHRDFKPANVLIGSDGPRVIDFGIAKSLDRHTMTSGDLKGTLVYMSPEQISGDTVAPASDIFSWGATMLFAATGRHAFGGNSHPHIFRMITSHHPDLSVLPPALRGPVGACLAKNPGERPNATDVMLAVTN
ncbi:serine/threonine-protein kinase [Sinosporangium album]|uniref:serine/threonine-protein kinase n=1 Tax=Sinosporangium album TaxID=504805 RepID=UPI00115FB37D|nr:serine/threonine-protein kinase [Sinosporangium album]